MKTLILSTLLFYFSTNTQEHCNYYITFADCFNQPISFKINDQIIFSDQSMTTDKVIGILKEFAVEIHSDTVVYFHGSDKTLQKMKTKRLSTVTVIRTGVEHTYKLKLSRGNYVIINGCDRMKETDQITFTQMKTRPVSE